jgi:lipid-binding SYLF domain-containing protein
MKTQVKALLCLFALAAIGTVAGCQATPETHAERKALKSDAQAALDRMYAWGPDLKPFVDDAHAYAIFPSVGKAGLGVGGAYGRGEVYRGGEMIGYADITQATVGAQIGAQDFAELIVFENEAALKKFTDDKLDIAANASAVILKEGAAASMNYDDGVVILVLPNSGAMAEATIGGQKFDYTPSDIAAEARTASDEQRNDNAKNADNTTENRNVENNADKKDGVKVDVDVDKK